MNGSAFVYECRGRGYLDIYMICVAVGIRKQNQPSTSMKLTVMALIIHNS